MPYPGIREIRALTGNLVPCLGGVVGDIRQGKASPVRKSRNHLLPLKVKSFANVLKCGQVGHSEMAEIWPPSRRIFFSRFQPKYQLTNTLVLLIWRNDPNCFLSYHQISRNWLKSINIFSRKTNFFLLHIIHFLQFLIQLSKKLNQQLKNLVMP